MDIRNGSNYCFQPGTKYQLLCIFVKFSSQKRKYIHFSNLILSQTSSSFVDILVSFQSVARSAGYVYTALLKEGVSSFSVCHPENFASKE